MKKIFIAILSLAFAGSSYAQERTADVKRIEIESESSVTHLSCNSIGEKD